MKKLLIYIVTYNHENIIKRTISRIPKHLNKKYKIDILVSDDFSKDNTYEEALKYSKNCKDLNISVIKTSENLGYGGNQKLGYFYAIKNDYDLVALIHGDGQYSPEFLGDLLFPFENDFNKIDMVLGSRMINKLDAIKGKMPIYKFIGNIILTKIQNFFLKSNLAEFHTGYKIYKVSALKNINFEKNTNDFHFDTEIIAQFLINNYVIKEIPIKTFYGDEVCNVNGVIYAKNCITTLIKYKLMTLGIFNDIKYIKKNYNENKYETKLNFYSPHSLVFNSVKFGSNVLDLGSGEGFVCDELKYKKNCNVKMVDNIDKNTTDEDKILLDLNKKLPDNNEVDWSKIDYVIALDIIEHLQNPENFVTNLRNKIANNKKIKVIASTGNIAFLVTRIMLFLGLFNYGKRGILDLTHTRLFTFSSFKKLFKDSDFNLINTKGIPAPFPLVFGNNLFSKILLNINRFFILISKSIFSYQIYFELEVRNNTFSELNFIENQIKKTN